MNDAQKDAFLDKVALETMKTLLADPTQAPEDDETPADFREAVAESSYHMARAMWKAKTNQTPEEA